MHHDGPLIHNGDIVHNMYQYVRNRVIGERPIRENGQLGYTPLDPVPNSIQKGDTSKLLHRMRQQHLDQHRQQAIATPDSTFPRLRDVLVVGGSNGIPQIAGILVKEGGVGEAHAAQNPRPVPDLHVDRVFLHERPRLRRPALPPFRLAPAGNPLDHLQQRGFLRGPGRGLDELALGWQKRGDRTTRRSLQRAASASVMAASSAMTRLHPCFSTRRRSASAACSLEFGEESRREVSR